MRNKSATYVDPIFESQLKGLAPRLSALEQAERCGATPKVRCKNPWQPAFPKDSDEIMNGTMN